MGAKKVPRARHDTVILVREYEGRIALPGDDADQAQAARLARSAPLVVFDVGPGTHGEMGWIPTVVKKGDKVIFRGEADGREIDGVKYWFTRDCHVMGVLEDEPEPDLSTAAIAP